MTWDILVNIVPDSALLTHIPLDKMASISQTAFPNAFSWMKNFEFLIEMSLKFVPKGPIDNYPAFV